VPWDLVREPDESTNWARGKSLFDVDLAAISLPLPCPGRQSREVVQEEERHISLRPTSRERSHASGARALQVTSVHVDQQ
jgi:hypothetical protein